MIKLEIMDICNDCIDFEPASNLNEVRTNYRCFEYFTEEKDACDDIVITCVHKKRCEKLLKRLLKHIEKIKDGKVND